MQGSTASPSLPSGTKQLSHQVAGHVETEGENSKKKGPCFLETEDGFILKPLQAPPRGVRELNFYEKVNDPNCSDPVVLKLRPLLAKYHGAKSFDAVPAVQYIQLEDVVHRFREPNIADIKMGAVTYDPLASPAKIQREKMKFPPLEKIGFQIRGFKLFDSKSGDFRLYDKPFTRSLDEETICTKGLATFFTSGTLRHDVIREVLLRVRQIRTWFESQSQFAFYSSSLLIVYEGAAPANTVAIGDVDGANTGGVSDHECNGSAPLTSAVAGAVCNGQNSRNGSVAAPVADVRMIDFAHVFETTKPDDNYMKGLKNLIQYLERLLTM